MGDTGFCLFPIHERLKSNFPPCKVWTGCQSLRTPLLKDADSADRLDRCHLPQGLGWHSVSYCNKDFCNGLVSHMLEERIIIPEVCSPQTPCYWHQQPINGTNSLLLAPQAHYWRQKHVSAVTPTASYWHLHPVIVTQNLLLTPTACYWHQEPVIVTNSP